MSNFRYLYNNLIDAALTVSTEDSVYVKENLYNQRIGKPFKFTADGGNIVIDLGSAQPVDAIAILAHNLTNSATITLEGNATDSWGAPAKSENITWATKNAYKIFTEVSFRYWRLVIADGTNPNNVKIGELVICTGVELSSNYQFGAVDTPNHVVLTEKTEYGQSWNYYLTSSRVFELSFMAQPVTQDEINILFNAVKGSFSPFVFISHDDLCYYVRMGNDLPQELQYSYANISIKLTEEPEGKEI